MKHVPGLLALLICISACNSSKKVTIQPPAETPARLLPAMPGSIINIPFKIYMKPLLAMMDSTSPKEFTNDKWPDYTQSGCDFRYKFRFVRSPFTFGCVNNKVTIGFRGNYQIAGSTHRFRDDKPGGHGYVDMTKSIVASCDTYYYMLAGATDIDDTYAFMSQFGFGQKTGIDLEGELPGVLP